MGITELWQTAREQGLNVYGIELCCRGVTGSAGDCTTRSCIYSGVKSITSTAVGIAAAEGLLDIKDPLADYLPAGYDIPEDFRKLDFRRFLTMSVKGFPFRPEGEDWLRTVLSTDIDYTAPPEFAYTNVSAYLVGVACENAVGEPLMDYLQPRLFTPLGIDLPEYQCDNQGRFYGATGMKLSVSELCLLGRLYLNGGVWKGRKIVPEAWVREAVSRQIANAEGGYGYFFWRNGESVYSISGKWGQKVLVCPEKELVLAYMGNMPEDSGKMLTLALKYAKTF